MTEQPPTEQTETERPVFVEVVARNIRIQAAAKGIPNLADVSEAALGLKHPALSKRMSGSIDWKLSELLDVARYFDVPLSVIAPDSLTEDVLR